MITLLQISEYLKNYNGKPVRLMEVCGTHTSVIAKNGIRRFISDKISLISGPGCPVCVTPPEYIDYICQLSKEPGNVVATFGDMMKVSGTNTTLYEAKAMGGNVKIVYSPIELIEEAKRNPDTKYIMAAVGFETTAPVYALMIKRAIEQNITNLLLVTSLKRIIPAIEYICESEDAPDGFIAPGNVAAVIGSGAFTSICNKYGKPFSVAGFTVADVLFSIYDLVKMINDDQAEVHNMYKGVVRETCGSAQKLIDEYFQKSNGMWRGIGEIPNSSYEIKPHFNVYSGKNYNYAESVGTFNGCRCKDVILGRITPVECSLFGTKCTPLNPTGPCMVSGEGSCRIWFIDEQI